jgi:hypothetical protein
MDASKEKVQARVSEMLNEQPGASTDELQAAAMEVDPSLSTLSRRQFNAGYVLPVKRTRAGSSPARTRGPARATKRRAARRGRKAQTAPQADQAETPTAPARRSTRAAAGAASSRPSGEDRERVREVLLRFAADLTRAESRIEVIDFLGSVDSYADDILKVTR